MSKRHHRHPHAFTLIELLVVIGIISILIGILLPVLAGARRSANNLKCQATMRELGLALTMYMGANKGYLPAARTGPEAFDQGSVKISNPPGAYVFWWMRLQQLRLIPGLDDPTRGVAICPSHETPYWPFQEYPDHKNLQTSYGINQRMTIASDGQGGVMDSICDFQGYRHPKVAGAKNSSEKILLGEVRQYGWLVNYYAPNTYQGYDLQQRSDWFDWDWYRHSKTPGKRTNGRSNVLWLDCHVTTVNQGKDAPSYFNNEIFSAVSTFPSNLAVAERGKRQWFPNVP